jgi:hypothetical protein
VAEPQAVEIGPTRGDEVRILDFEHRQIESGVASRDARRGGAAVTESESDSIFTLDSMIGGQDDTLRPRHPRGRASRPRFDADDGSCDRIHHGRQLLRQIDCDITHDLLPSR